MARMFIRTLRAEWLKKKHSLAAWLILGGALFTPLVVTLARLLHPGGLALLYRSPTFWQQLWHSAWESMAIFLAPLMVILAVSLVTQIEYRNNAWKQVHALPLDMATIFFAKLLVVLVMLLQFFVLFDFGVWLSAVVPAWLIRGVDYPAAPLPLADFARQTAQYFFDCLPIVAAQYLLGTHYRNFLVAVGVGFLAWVAALAALSSSYASLVPYSFTMLDYLRDVPSSRIATPPFDIHLLALGYFVLLLGAGFVLFVRKPEKG